jgi:hypothetical protein
MSADDRLDALMEGFEQRRVAVQLELRNELLRLGLSSEAPLAAAPLTHCPVCKQRLRKARPEFHGLKIVDGKRRD